MTRIRGDIKKVEDIEKTRSDVGYYPVVDNVGVAEVLITFPSISNFIYLENIHATQNLSYRFSLADPLIELVPGQNKGIAIRKNGIYLVGSGAATTYQLEMTYLV